MKLKTIAYAALIAVAAVALCARLGHDRRKPKARRKWRLRRRQPMMCLHEAPEPVCGSLKGHKFTYANACSAYKDGATIVSKKACAAKKRTRPSTRPRRQ